MDKKVLCCALVFAFQAFRPLGVFSQTTAASPTETAVSEGSLYRFQSKTAWGDIEVLVRDLGRSFQVEVNSGSTVAGWTLKEEKTGRILSKGGLNPTSEFKFKVNEPFRDSYRLVLYLVAEREEVPVGIRLIADKENKSQKNLSEGLEDYQDNPDHPYHVMVKTFYEQALESYSTGDNLHALKYLNKAQELDPLQPQVQALLDKIQGPTEKADNLLDQAKDDLKKGKKEEALAKLDDYLNQNPGDEEAQQLKDRLGEKSRAAEPAKKKRPKASQVSSPTVKPILATNDKDLQAKADQSYNLGLDSYRQGDYAAAKKFWEETLQIQPTHAQAKRNLDRLEEEHPELK